MTESSLPLPCSNSDEQFCHKEDEVLSTDCGGFTTESLQCDSTSDDELLQFTERKSMYTRFIKEDDTGWGGGALGPCLGIGVPVGVLNPDPV